MCASGLEGCSTMDSFQDAIASSNSSGVSYQNILWGHLQLRHTQMIVRDAEIKERACVALDLGTTFIHCLCRINISFFEFLKSRSQAR